ncbi:MAG: LptF/LptG family permease, partial [Acidiferrobacterales bacterium]
TLSLVVRPWAYEQSYWLRARAAVEFDITKLEPGRFHEEQPGNRVIFVEKLNRKQNRVEGVFIQKEYGDIVQVIYAREAYHQVDETTGERILVCLDTHLYELSRNGNGDLIGQFGEVRIVMEEREIEPAGYKRKAASTTHLARSDSTEDIAEIQWRLSTALSTMLLGLLGFPLSRAEARQGKYSKLLLAVLIYAGYYTINVMARTWVEQGVVGALPGIWWVNALLAALVLALLWPTARTIWLPRS